jgi:hypothetical protein
VEDPEASLDRLPERCIQETGRVLGNILGYETRVKLTEEELGAILADMEE